MKALKENFFLFLCAAASSIACVALAFILAFIFLWAVTQWAHAEIYQPTTYLFRSTQYSIVIGKKNCGPHKARLFLREVLQAKYGKRAKVVEKRFNLIRVEGL